MLVSPRPPFRSRRLVRDRTAFTLVELLVVMAIIGVMVALVLPSFKSIGGAQDISAAGDLIAANFDLARQTAITDNQRVDLRLWDLPDAQGAGGGFRGLQLFRVDTGKAIGKVQKLPNSVVMLPSQTFSTLLGTANPYPPVGTIGDVAGLTGRSFKSVRFGPDGSTDLDPSLSWTVTVANPNAPVGTAGQPSVNYATIQVDPVTGRTTLYRP